MTTRFIQKPSLIFTTLSLIALTSFLSISVFAYNWHYAFIILLPFYIPFLRYISKNSISFISIFSLPFIISSFSLVGLYLSLDTRFSIPSYFWLGRLINIILMILFFLLSVNLFLRSKRGEEYFLAFTKFYMLGGVILALTVLWQLTSYYTSLIDFPFITRDHIHSATGLTLNQKTRATGIAAEPSYLVPYMVDMIVISLLVYGVRLQSILISSMAVIALIFSYSPTGFLILIGASIFSSITYIIKFHLKLSSTQWITIFVTLIALVSLILLLNNSSLFLYIMTRIENFSPNNSSRAFMSLMIPKWQEEGNLFHFLYGYGLKSYSLLGQYYILPNGNAINSTSNNLFADTLWEAGLIGFVASLISWLYIFQRISSSNTNKKLKFILYFYFFDLIISSLARADYTSPRMFVFLIIIFYVTEKNHSINPLFRKLKEL